VNAVKNPTTDVIAQSKSSNRINNKGDAFEFYIRDLFCNTFSLAAWEEKDEIYSQNFSFLWAQNSPPDLIIKWSDALEIKKMESVSGDIALNSSYPKDKLHRNDSRINAQCRWCDGASWQEKDFIYTIWTIPAGGKLKVLWFVYGDCYAASQDTYENIFNPVRGAIIKTPWIIFSKTNELARVNSIDPLGITCLRVRGMWHIKHPIKVFWDSLIDKTATLSIYAIVSEDKYRSFPQKDIVALEELAKKEPRLKIKDIKIKSPNNTAVLINAKLIQYAK